jgi:hypothetical protein
LRAPRREPQTGNRERRAESGDLIEEVNRQPVQTVEELRAALKRPADKPVLLLVNRQRPNVFVTIPVAKD